MEDNVFQVNNFSNFYTGDLYCFARGRQDVMCYDEYQGYGYNYADGMGSGYPMGSGYGMGSGYPMGSGSGMGSGYGMEHGSTTTF